MLQGTLAVIAFGIFLFFVYQIIARIIRSININTTGWPPPHLNADGDSVNDELDLFKKKD